MELLLRILFWCPKCWQKAGIGLFSFSFTMLLLGGRLAGKTQRVQRRTGLVIDSDQILASMPVPIPVTPEGFAFAGLGMVTGAALALAGKWAKNSMF